MRISNVGKDLTIAQQEESSRIRNLNVSVFFATSLFFTQCVFKAIKRAGKTSRKAVRKIINRDAKINILFKNNLLLTTFTY